jgi:hypothetical protein
MGDGGWGDEMWLIDLKTAVSTRITIFLVGANTLSKGGMNPQNV